MSRTRANWFVQEATPLDTEPDPFSIPIEEVGERFDLRDPKAALELRVHELLGREARLFATGVTCPIKERPDTTCHACPLSKAHDPEQALSALCRIGREQEVVLTELAALTCHDQ